MSCYCCAHSEEDDVKQFHEFAVDNAHIIPLHEMANQFVEMYPDRDTAENVQVHLETHFLHPCVHVARIMRELMHMASDLRNVMTNYEGEDESPLIDIRSAQMYLKVVNEIMQIYKTADLKKMMFSDL